ncbi:Gfo/Idh/MocA family protein [Pelagibacterium montanilacus]|uniref:Gfo/Idh/MocA family protein n=1 Tax=Pelagibacterium montanilacus TaxID=2185280 RepID=UPI000F8E2D32|nr:Gfo/Idh/MocA family oxidoreductase [Pelagibacterium montanilacus]
MAQELVWGSFGTANIGRKVLPAIAAAPGMRLGAVGSRDADRAGAYADELGFARSYGSYEALLADAEITAIYNPLPNDMHVPMSIAAMRAGKHVLCEKPIAMTAEEAETLRAVQKETGRIVVEAFMVRHHPQWLRARERVRSGELGEVRAIQTFFSYNNTDKTDIRNQPTHGGGGLYDIGCYAIATARFIFEADPETASGMLDIDPDFGTDRLASGLLMFPGSRHLTFSSSTQLSNHQRVTIVGTKGRLEVLIPFNAAPDLSMTISFDSGDTLTGESAVGESFDPVDQYTRQAIAFREAMERPDDFSAIDDAVANMRTIDAMFRSATSGRHEPV